MKKTRKRALISGAVSGLFIALFWSQSIGYGFLSGVAVSIVNFQLMSADAYMIVSKNPQKVRMFVVKKYFLRFAIIFGFLGLVATRTHLNLFAAFVGVFFIQFTIIVWELLQRARLVVKTPRD